MKRELAKEDAVKIREYQKKIQDKRTDHRMLAVQQRSEGKRNKDIAEILGVDPRIISQ